MRGKLTAKSPVISSSSSVAFPLFQVGWPAPISRVPAGEAQLQWLRRFFSSLCDGDQLSPLSLTQVVCGDEELPPPHASSPVCVWESRASGRSGRLHQGNPYQCRSSTELRLWPSLYPPEIRIAAGNVGELEAVLDISKILSTSSQSK